MRDTSVNDVDRDMAMAFGLFALSDASLPEVAKEVDVTRWELEDAIENAGLAETFDLDKEGDASSAIDDVLDDNS